MRTQYHTGKSQPEILWNAEYTARALTLDESAFNPDGVCKAGSPISESGEVVNDETAIGILLHDVYKERPQGTIIIYGYVDSAKAENHSGVAVSALARAAMKNVIFMPDGGI